MKNNHKAFSLMELLIIVGIISVLVGIAIPIFFSQLERAKQTVDKTSVRNAYTCAQLQCMEGCESGLYYYNISFLSLEKTNYKCGKSSHEFESFCDIFNFPVFGVPKDNYLSVYIQDNQISWMQWGSYPVITSAAQYTSTSHTNRVKLDKSLTNRIQTTLQNMTYNEILNMFGSANVGQNDKNGKKIEKWTGTCYTIAISYINPDGTINQSRNSIFAQDLFARSGYSVDNTDQAYLITSWEYGSSSTYQDDLKIKIDVGKDLSKLSPNELNQKASTTFVYLNGNGLPRTDENFGHERKNK